MSDKPETIVITAPAGTKARWVRESQARGMKLGDWVRQTMDKPANKTTAQPCSACGSRVATYDRGDWLCAGCGVVL